MKLVQASCEFNRKNSKDAIYVVYKGNEKLGIPDLLEELKSTFKSLGWDALNLGRCLDRCHEDEVLQDLNGITIVKSYRSLCTHAYMVSRHGAEKMLKLSKKITLAEDEWRWREKSALKYYSVTPRIFIQKRSESHIHGTEEMAEECTSLY